MKALEGRPELVWIPDFLSAHPGAELFLVGGAVRDALLGRPTKDFDFVVRGLSKEKIEQWFSERGSIDLVGRTFGVYKFSPSGIDTEPIDIALPRTEQALPGSHGGYREFDVQARIDLPLELDLGRRDFTVNAIAYDMRQQEFVDPFHGRRDLEARVLRTVGDPSERFREDLSRLLRAVRFACQLSFHIEDHTWEAVVKLVPRLNDKQEDKNWVVPRETIGREFLKSFAADSACTLARLQASGMNTILFPDVDLAMSERLVADASALRLRLRLALLLMGTDPSGAKQFLTKFHLNQFPKSHPLHINEEDVVWLLRSVNVLDIIENPMAMPGSVFEKLFLGPRGSDLLDLILLTKNASDKKLALVQERLADIQARFGDEIPELVSGDDLIAAGYKPGPEFRALLARIRDAQIAGDIETKKDALALLK